MNWYLNDKIWLVHCIFFTLIEYIERKPPPCKMANGELTECPVVLSVWLDLPDVSILFKARVLQRHPPQKKNPDYYLLLSLKFTWQSRRWTMVFVLLIGRQNIPSLSWINNFFCIGIRSLTFLSHFGKTFGVVWSHPLRYKKVTPTSKYWLHLYFSTFSHGLTNLLILVID